MGMEEQRLSSNGTSNGSVEKGKAADLEDNVTLEDLEPPNLFYSLSWDDWLELQAKAVQAFAHFQQAAEHPNPHSLVHAAEELMVVAVKLVQESALWVPFLQSPRRFSVSSTE
ncbi:hypothetical protein EPA93_34810 [Ktedonosporobacter rubrisoli]|uniref:Uncharacterized protein n=1 Tax=Ktedonosporobacter rubrisoli TaxID=2509675 RepID=A0A4P6JYS0_KTERU|nr:hypothetical protein [Ktedonosporobacter rubrisoli]QBD80864.1 hypothetical protein EPA93_34810 [Ktedonosporobacter rubrisoli]